MMMLQPDNLPPFTRPVRIPEHIEILQAAPPSAYAGETSSWKLSLKLAESVSCADLIRLQIYGGRNNTGVFSPLQVENPKAEGYVSARTEDGAEIELCSDFEIEEPATKGEQLLTGSTSNPGLFIIKIPEKGLKAGKIIEVIIGDPSQGAEGTTATTSSLYNKFFVLYKAKSSDDRPLFWGPENWEQILGVCSMHIIGSTSEMIRVYGPAQCQIGEKVSLLVRPEDQWGNLSFEELNDLALYLDDEKIPADISKLPQSTCVRIVSKFERPGVLRPVISDESGREAVCTPIICSDQSDDLNAFWGMIHGHTEMSDGTGTVEYYFRQMRDESRLDFGGTGDHDHIWETTDEMWRNICETVAEFNEPNQFVTFLGYEWAKWRKNGDGDRNVYYLADHRPLYRSAEGHTPTPPDLFNVLKNEKAIIIPHHTAHSGNWCDWKDHDPEHERLVEIFQFQGSYECEKDNPLLAGGGNKAIGFIDHALKMGWRVGFTAGGDDHSGHAGTDAQVGTYQNAGLMCVWAEKLDRKSLWQALWKRRVTATSGPRILLDFTLNDRFMGSEISVAENSKLASSRMITIKFHGTAPAKQIEVMRNSEAVKSFFNSGLDCELKWEDTLAIQEILLPSDKFCDHPFCYYYIRVVQDDDHVAWTSPIWIDDV
jgi:Protein of unknown function (DUF3604)